VIECWARIIKPQGLAVYTLLANSDFNEEHPGVVYPSQQKIAEILGISRPRVNEWIKILGKYGLITIKRRSRYYLIYILNKVKCPNSKDGIHRDVSPADISSEPDVTPADILRNTRCNINGHQMYHKWTPDVTPADTNKNKEQEQITRIISLSKDKGSESSFSFFGNKDINELISLLKEKNQGFLDGSERMNRRYCWNLLIKFRYKEKPQKAVETIKFIIEMGFQDDFHRQNLTNFRYLFYHAKQIVEKYKSRFNQIAVIKTK